jgi:demethylmenaquinone methyltransferase/2-methoxy-6-polyprenyl-1,4-benzoquinol methylase
MTSETSQRTAAGSAVWTDDNLHQPHEVADKARRVEAMFAAIAPSYDLNNRLHSLGRDQAWRRAAVRTAQVKPDDVVLDVACGTGDLTMAFAQSRTSPARVMGVDFTYNMLTIARDKARQVRSSVPLSYQLGDAMNLPVADASVDVVSIAFGIRNVAQPQVAMQEFYRVLRPGGRLIVLEFSLPSNPLMLAMYNFYFRHIMPRTAALIARDYSGAYRYLPKSVNTFIGREQMLEMMQNTGLSQTTCQPLTMGIAVVYRGIKA